MTLTEARKRVARIDAMKGDAEAAHAEEDNLRSDVLAYLAQVAPAELGALAEIALSTDAISFERWYA